MKKPVKFFDGISLKILLSYLSILLIPLLAIIIIYNASITVLLNFQQEKTMYGLDQTANTVDIRIEELNNINSYIQSNPTVNSIVNTKYAKGNERDIFVMKSTIESFPSYQLTNQLIANVYIFFTEVNYIAKLPNGFAFTPEKYYDNVAFKGLNFEELQELCKGNYVGNLYITSNEQGTDVLLLRSVDGSETLVAIQLNIKSFNDILLTNETGTGGGTYVLNNNGELVSGVGKAHFSTSELYSLANEDEPCYREVVKDDITYLMYVHKSGELIYISLTEKSHLLKSISSIKFIIVLLGLAALLMGVIICVMLWRRRRSLIQSVADKAKSMGVLEEPLISEAHLVETTVNSLANTVDSLRETLNQQKDRMLQTVLQNILQGTFHSRVEMMQEAEKTSLDLSYSYYHVVNVILLKPCETENERTQTLPYRIFLKQFLDETLDMTHYFCDMDNTSFVLLLCGEEKLPVKDLKKMFKSLSDQSEAVNIPENALYRNFKTYFGVSFSNYLEQCRINKAFELLREQVPIKDVAQQVGYTSDHTFRRAFKRIMKVPPSQFFNS